jgi:hypothetical protein
MAKGFYIQHFSRTLPAYISGVNTMSQELFQRISPTPILSAVMAPAAFLSAVIYTA